MSSPVTTLSASGSDLIFSDVTKAAGLQFTHVSGAAGQRWYPETIGSGVAFFDYDGDAKPDLLFVNGRNWPYDPAWRHARRAEALGAPVTELITALRRVSSEP
jgi:hypothetical protein